MYTVIFYREPSDDNNKTEFTLRCIDTLKDLHSFLRLKAFDQERIKVEHERANGVRYYMGDYSFLVLKNGKTIFESAYFTDIAQDVEVPEQHEDYDTSLNDIINSGARDFYDFHNKHYDTFMKNEEEEYKKHAINFQEMKRKKEVEEKEKSLLKELLAKYPNINQ